MIRSIFFDYENGFRLCSNVRDNSCSPGMAFDPSSFEENGRALFRVAHRDKSTTDLLLVVRFSELWIWRTDSNSRQLPSYKFSFLLPRQLPLNAHFNGITPKSTIVSVNKGDCSNSKEKIHFPPSLLFSRIANSLPALRSRSFRTRLSAKRFADWTVGKRRPSSSWK